MQRKINFNVPLKGLDDSVITDANGEVTLGKVFGPVVAAQNSGDALKQLSWAKAMYNNEDLHLDKSDINTLKEIINSNQQMTALVKAPLLELLDQE